MGGSCRSGHVPDVWAYRGEAIGRSTPHSTRGGRVPRNRLDPKLRPSASVLRLVIRHGGSGPLHRHEDRADTAGRHLTLCPDRRMNVSTSAA
jgi:hypothetical protein